MADFAEAQRFFDEFVDERVPNEVRVVLHCQLPLQKRRVPMKRRLRVKRARASHFYHFSQKRNELFEENVRPSDVWVPNSAGELQGLPSDGLRVKFPGFNAQFFFFVEEVPHVSFEFVNVHCVLLPH